MKRTHLPLNGLRVLDAAARHLSFTRAADELAVTPAAVGQQVRALEDTLGTVLFRRTTKGLELTAEGEAGLPALRRGFLEFEDAVRAMQEGQSSRHLAIAAPRDLTAKWLGARLAGFRASNPDVRIRLVAADGLVDFTEANLDLAIVHAERIDGHEALALDPAGVVTVGHEGGGTDEIRWGAGGESAGLTVADAGLAIDAVAAGLGQATVPALLAARDIAAGRIVQVGPETASSARYWLVAPLPQWRQKKVRALVEALAGTALGGGVPETAG